MKIITVYDDETQEQIDDIKEKIQEKHGFSCSNLRLYIMEGTEKKYLDAIMCRTFQELGINAEKFSLFYEFDPFVHPMLEASLI